MVASIIFYALTYIGFNITRRGNEGHIQIPILGSNTKYMEYQGATPELEQIAANHDRGATPELEHDNDANAREPQTIEISSSSDIKINNEESKKNR